MKSVSITGLVLIKNFEGLRLTAYKCPAGVPTIGYGHTKNVKMGDVITPDIADFYLYEDLQSSVKAVNEYDKIYNFTQNEFDALVSFTFNCGKGNLTKLTGKGTRNKALIGQKILAYNKAGGKVLNGLVRRRQAEHDLYFTR